MLVDGKKKFFEGDTKLGSKNIPADAVDKIQVLHGGDVSQLKGLENNNDDGHNIKLKSGKEFFSSELQVLILTNVSFINPKLFYYSPKTSVNVLTNFNNIGDVPFSIRII
jgi:hypothetical protein